MSVRRSLAPGLSPSPYRVPRNLGKCRDCGRVTVMHGDYCGACATKHGIRVPATFGNRIVERRK